MAPLIPETVMDAPTQRLYFLSFCALVQVGAFAGHLLVELLINDLLLLHYLSQHQYDVPRVLWTRATGAQTIRFLLDPTLTRTVVLPAKMGRSRSPITGLSLLLSNTTASAPSARVGEYIGCSGSFGCSVIWKLHGKHVPCTAYLLCYCVETPVICGSISRP